MRGPAIIWLMFISWLVHDLEEILLFYKFDYLNDRKINQLNNKWPLVRFIITSKAETQKEITVAIIIMGIFIFCATAVGYCYPLSLGFQLYEVFLGGYFLHTFTHIVQSIILQQYTPGVITAIIIVLPASIYIYKQLFLLGMSNFWEASLTGLIGVLVFIPLVILAHKIAKFACREI